MLLRRIIRHVKEQNWTAIALDFAIVVIGVFIGLQVNDWSSNRADKNREAVYLAALQDDFQTIIDELENDIAEYDAIVEATTFLLTESRKPEPDSSNEELNCAAKNLTKMVGTEVVSDTYANLTGSGDLAIIQSREIKTAMASFFAQYEVVKLIATTHELQLVNIFQPYVITNLDYVSFLPEDRGIQPPPGFEPEIISSQLQAAEFRNVVAVKWDIATDLRNALNSALLDARHVEALLSREVSDL